MVALSKGRLLSPLSLHSGDVASSHISLGVAVRVTQAGE